MTDYRRLRVALLGAGAVGSQVAALLRQHADELADRAGARLELVGIAVRNPDAPRDADLPFHATGGNFLARPKLPLHELSPRLQPPSPRRTTGGRPSSSHRIRTLTIAPSLTLRATRLLLKSRSAGSRK